MKWSIRKDLKNRKKYSNQEKNYRLVKLLESNAYISESLEPDFKKLLHKYGGVGVKIKNTCVETGRSRGVYRQFKLSRMLVKQELSSGRLKGLRKINW